MINTCPNVACYGWKYVLYIACNVDIDILSGIVRGQMKQDGDTPNNCGQVRVQWVQLFITVKVELW